MYLIPPAGGGAFIGNSGAAFNSAGQALEIPPGDMSSAFKNGWTAVPLTSQPGSLDVPQGNVVAYKLYQAAIPLVVSPTGSMANNGVVTLGTALTTNFEGGSIYLNLPAGAIATGSAAGWYYTVMTSTTVGTVYNNTYTAGQPYIPPSPVAFTTTGPGAYTGVTAATVAVSVPINGNLIGPNGRISITSIFGFNASTNNKTATLKYGAGVIFSQVQATAGVNSDVSITYLYNQGVTNKQVANTSGTIAASSTGQTFLTVDSTVSQTFTVNLTTAAATDWMSLDAMTLSVESG